MATSNDALGTPQPPNRVYYSLGRTLGVEDFQADQDYHRGRLARALLQVCGTGTVAGLNVSVPQIWQASTRYAAFTFVFDASLNVQVNTGPAGTSGNGPLTFAAAPKGTVNDGSNIVWTNQGPMNANGWMPNSLYVFPAAIVDSNSNVQILKGPANLTSGPRLPVWNTAIGASTADGTVASAWICVGPSQLEVEVTPGLAIDRVGRMIEVPRTVCIRIGPWLANQTLSDLTSALAAGSGNILVDVFATFIPCTRGVTPCFATQDDYDATDAFSANRLLDSFAMQLVLRSDSSPQLPKDPWLSTGLAPGAAMTTDIVKGLKRNLLSANSGPASMPPFSGNGAGPDGSPQGVDPSAVFLARISIPATAGAAGQPPNIKLMNTTIDNLSRLFLYPTSLLARLLGLSSGVEA
jgi:hypothetical protein